MRDKDFLGETARNCTKSTITPFKTNVDGIGLAIKFQVYSDGIFSGWSGWLLRDNGRWSGESGSGGEIAVRLVKYGRVTPGVVGNNAVFDFYGKDTYEITNSPVEVIVPTCQIKTNHVNVPMGDISMSKFTEVGSKSDPQKFKVSMTCPAGINKLSYLMDAAGGSHIDPSQPGALSLSNTNGASGVGVQVKDDDNNAFVNLGNPMPVGQYHPDQDNQHIDLNFEAAYIRTGTKVTGGEADAQATITMSYE